MTSNETVSLQTNAFVLAPRGLSRKLAAPYIGVSEGLFNKMVEDGRMPSPLRINGRLVWDRVQIDDAFDELHNTREPNPWDQ